MKYKTVYAKDLRKELYPIIDSSLRRKEPSNPGVRIAVGEVVAGLRILYYGGYDDVTVQGEKEVSVHMGIGKFIIPKGTCSVRLSVPQILEVYKETR